MKDLMDFIKSFDLHTIIVVGIAFWWMNSGINAKLDLIQNDISSLKTEIAVIKAVMIMKNIMPAELACKEKEQVK